jgi:putative ABC transport system permease protein
MKLRRLPLPLRFALRDLSGDLRGFAVFIACIVIGVAAIAGVGAASRSLAAGLAREGRTILGGDLALAVTSRRLTPPQREFLERAGRVGEIALLRAMARSAAGEAALIEIKAVDSAYPLAGAVTLAPPQPLGDALAPRDGVPGVAADATLIARLDLKIGDRLKIGAGSFELRAELVFEPDKLASGVGFGSRVLMSEEGLAATGLDRPGVIMRRIARVALGPSGAVAEDAALDRFGAALSAAFPSAGWELRRRDAVSPQFSRNQERFTQLLTLVALTALVAGGTGVANAVDGFVARKRDAFAILKAVGAPASRVFAIALTEVMLVAAIAIASGLALGAALPFLLDQTLAASVGLPFQPTLDLRSLLIGALCGFLVTLIFALPPLGRAYGTPVARLLREETEETHAPKIFLLAAFGAAALLVAAVLALSADPRIAGVYIAATGAAFLALRGVAALVVAAARRAPRAGSLGLRHAVANIGRPKNLAAPLVLSIGLTQTLLIALALVEGSIHAELAPTHDSRTPSFYFVDVAKEQAEEFASFLSAFAPGAKLERAPMLRGRIVAVKGAPAGALHPPDDIAWALEGDRGVTFASTLPEGSTLAAGRWWDAAEDAGPPLVSLETRIAEGLGLSIGDTITVNVLGREVTARIANLRRVEWSSFGINFVMVFSSGAFADAPFSQIFTVAFPDRADSRRDARLTREVATRFPAVAAIRVKDALDAAATLADRLSLAARGAAAIAMITAALALGSAVAASQETRMREAVILRTLGATRGFLTRAYGIEFALLGAVAGAVAVGAGSGAAALILVTLMRMDFAFRPWPVALTTLGALAFAIGLGLVGSWRVLGRRPGAALRRR